MNTCYFPPLVLKGIDFTTGCFSPVGFKGNLSLLEIIKKGSEPNGCGQRIGWFLALALLYLKDADWAALPGGLHDWRAAAKYVALRLLGAFCQGMLGLSLFAN